jgi:hypothetical protein
MFNRDVLNELSSWREKKDRKPLILRGARQVGKTTAINLFSGQFEQYLYLNLEIKAERDIFEQDHSIEDLLQAIFFHKNQVRGNGSVLIFIDEIQNSPSAVSKHPFGAFKTADKDHAQKIAQGPQPQSPLPGSIPAAADTTAAPGYD